MPREDEQADRIEAYTKARYVLGERVPPIDESQAVRVLDTHLSQVRFPSGERCGYLGILWFEVSFQPAEDARRCLDRARMWLFRARWRCDHRCEAIEERLTDIDDMLLG